MRALLGGALITLAVAGLWWSYTLSTAAPSTQYVVAVSDIAPGTVVTSDHVGLQAIDLPASIAAGAFEPSRDEDVLGAVAINFIAAGELVSTSDIRPVLGGPIGSSVLGGRTGNAVSARALGAQSRYELSLEIELARVLNGQLLPGEFVDVIATSGTGAGSTTRRIAIDAQVLAIAEIGEQSFGLGTVAVTLAVASDVTVLEIVAATDQGVVTLVRAPLQRLVGEALVEPGATGTSNADGTSSGAAAADQSQASAGGGEPGGASGGGEPGGGGQ